MNYLGCSLKTQKFILENIHFDCKKYEIIKYDFFFISKEQSINLYMINHFKNIEQIDLDWNVDNNKTKPVKILYLFGDLKNIYDTTTLKNNLNNFVNSPVNYENIFFKNDEGEIETHEFGKFKIGQLFTINENFITYYMEYPISMGYCNFFSLFISGNVLFSLILNYFLNKWIEKNQALIISLIIGILMFISCFICYIFDRRSIKRIDIIFSNSFDKIFIGFVYNGKAKYKNIFIENINNIKEFRLNEYNNNNYTFGIIMKNDDTINFGEINRKMIDSNFHDLIRLLNDKLNN